MSEVLRKLKDFLETFREENKLNFDIITDFDNAFQE
jgi:hypothetical protein